jgi:nucleosome binding factor SPN SPT16 subunit
VINLLRVGKEEILRLGTLTKETARCSDFENAVAEALPKFSGFFVNNCEEIISRLLENKDAAEVRLTKGASNFACALMDVFRKKIEDIVDQGRQVKHSQVCREIEEISNDQIEIDKIWPKSAHQPRVPEISGTCSSWTFDPSSQVGPQEDLVAVSGTYVLTVSTRCCSCRAVAAFPWKLR